MLIALIAQYGHISYPSSQQPAAWPASCAWRSNRRFFRSKRFPPNSQSGATIDYRYRALFEQSISDWIRALTDEYRWNCIIVVVYSMCRCIPSKSECSSWFVFLLLPFFGWDKNANVHLDLFFFVVIFGWDKNGYEVCSSWFAFLSFFGWDQDGNVHLWFVFGHFFDEIGELLEVSDFLKRGVIQNLGANSVQSALAIRSMLLAIVVCCERAVQRPAV